MSVPNKPKVKVLIWSDIAAPGSLLLPGQLTLEQAKKYTSPKPLRLPPPPPQPPERKKKDSA